MTQHRDESTPDFTLPRVSPTGIVEYPEGYQGSPRKYPRPLKFLAVVVLVAFALVTVITTSATLGAWCLTSDSAPPAGMVELAP